MRLLRPLADLGPGDRARFYYSLAAFMCVASAALVARTVGDSLFLSRYGAGLLSYMYVATAVVVIAASFAFGSLSSRVSLGRLIRWTCIAICLATVVLWLLLAFPWAGWPVVAYLLSDLVVNLPMILFWSFAALLFNPREAKRLFGFIGAGGTVGCIVAGTAVPYISATFGAPSLLLVVAGLMAGFLVLSGRLSASEPQRVASPAQPPGRRRTPRSTSYSSLLGSPQIRSLLLLVVTATLTLTLVDFQFKAVVGAQYTAHELAGFFGGFYAYASLVALLLQLFAVHWILRRGGVFAGLALLPLGLLAAAVGASITGSFWWMIGMKFVVQVLLFTVDVAAVQMLYLGVPQQSRSQARAFVDGIAKPASMAVAGAADVDPFDEPRNQPLVCRADLLDGNQIEAAYDLGQRIHHLGLLRLRGAENLDIERGDADRFAGARRWRLVRRDRRRRRRVIRSCRILGAGGRDG